MGDCVRILRFESEDMTMKNKEVKRSKKGLLCTLNLRIKKKYLND